MVFFELIQHTNVFYGMYKDMKGHMNNTYLETWAGSNQQ